MGTKGYSKEELALENYLVNVVLKWKLAYFTPFDYLQAIAQRAVLQNPLPALNLTAIVAKAVHIIELLLLCILPA